MSKCDKLTSTERKKVRGRKNRYFRQIDNEDHEAGVLLDDDDEGNREKTERTLYRV